MRFFILAALFVLFNATPALADCALSGTAVCNGAPCAGETRPEGALVYNADHAVLQACSGGRWRALSPLTPPCDTGPIGTVCTSDGAVYAGDTVGGARMYVAAADESGTITWGGYGNNDAADSTTDGLANTNALVADGHGHPAAQACRNRGADWYLPAKDELRMLYDNRAQLGAANLPTSSSYYWSSTENTNSLAWFQRFSDGHQNAPNKNNHRLVRCVRR